MNTISANSVFEICSLEEIPDRQGRIFEIPSQIGNFSIIILRSGDSCYGYVNRCPHFGMPLAEVDSQLVFDPDNWIKCNVHYAQFRWQNGYCIAGDCAGESLQKFPLEILNGKVLKVAS
jgi:nitrite reductase/ring-hydroxylating ferredoxin subunit